jgi:hypothetical protein
MKILLFLIIHVLVTLSLSALAVDTITATARTDGTTIPGSCGEVYADCRAAVVNAANICDTLNLDKYGGQITLALSLLSAGGSLTNSCAKYDEIMKVAHAGMATYHAACAIAQNGCQTACAKAPVAVESKRSYFFAEWSRMAGIPGAQAAAETTRKMVESCVAIDAGLSEKLIVSCAAIKTNVLAAVAGVVSIAAENDAAKECKKKTSTEDCTQNPTDPRCFVDCSKPEHATKATCICQKTPNAKGCPGAVAYEAGPGMQTNGNPTAEAPLEIPTPNFDGAGGSDGLVGGPASGSGLSGGGGGGAGGGSGSDSSSGFSGGGKAADGAGKNGAKKLNTDILSGIDGGGGGGGGGGRGGGARPANSAYPAYLPGGAKDPARDLASANYAKEVTTGGSKSNWQKINERYLQFRPTLNAGP